MSTFLLVLGIYLVGALITWRIAYGRWYNKLYLQMAQCRACVAEAAGSDSKFDGCSGHKYDVASARDAVVWAVLCWPFLLLGIVVFYTGKLLKVAINRAAFPRGNRTSGYLAWTQAKTSLEYKAKARDLRWELRGLGIDPESWMPEDPILEPTYNLSPRQLESQGWALGRRLEEVSMALRQAKEITDLKVGDDAKRLAIEATLLVPYRVKANVKPSEPHQWHEELRVSGSK